MKIGKGNKQENEGRERNQEGKLMPGKGNRKETERREKKPQSPSSTKMSRRNDRFLLNSYFCACRPGPPLSKVSDHYEIDGI